jgi:hypothetical protein
MTVSGAMSIYNVRVGTVVIITCLSADGLGSRVRDRAERNL